MTLNARVGGLVSLGMFVLGLGGACSAVPQEEEAAVGVVRAALNETARLAFRITGVRAPNGSSLNGFSAVRLTMRTSLDDNQSIGNQWMFLCGTALGPTFGGGIPCNQGGAAQFHDYPAYANLRLTGVSTLPEVYLRSATFPPSTQNATVDVSFGLTPGPGSGFGGETLFSSSAGSLRLNVDLATGVIEPAFAAIPGAVCGFRREDGTSFGSCPRTCSATSGPECRQNCAFLSAAGGPWEVCYDVDTCAPQKEVPDGVDNDCDGAVDECDPGQTDWWCCPSSSLSFNVSPALPDTLPPPACVPTSVDPSSQCSLRGVFEIADRLAPHSCLIEAHLPSGRYELADEALLRRGNLRLLGSGPTTTRIEPALPNGACVRLCTQTCHRCEDLDPNDDVLCALTPFCTGPCRLHCGEDPSCNSERDPLCDSNCGGPPHHRLLNVSADPGEFPALDLRSLALRGANFDDAFSSGAGVLVRGGSLTAFQILVEENRARGLGVGLAFRDAAVATITDSVIRNNVNMQVGPSCTTGPSLQSGGATAFGGGVFASDSTVTIVRSAITGNVSSDGGGIVSVGGTLLLRNNTISGNSTPGRGGGILTQGDTTLEFNTIAFNISGTNFNANPDDGRGAGLAADPRSSGPPLRLRAFGNIISDNERVSPSPAGSTDCAIGRTGAGWTTEAGFNLIRAGTACPELLVNGGLTGGAADPGFDAAPGQSAGAFSPDFPAPTSDALVHALRAPGALPAGTAVDEYPQTAVPSCPTVDQRGFLRPLDAPCDLGSYELQAFANLDLDGIADPIDTVPAGFSNDFDDHPAFGITRGTITTRGDQDVTVEDGEGLEVGVVVRTRAGGGAAPAHIVACGGAVDVTLGPGAAREITCPRAQHCVFASGALTLRDRARVLSDFFAGSFGFGFDAFASRNAFSLADGALGDRAVIAGNATLGGVLSGNRAGVQGVLRERAAVAPEAVLLRTGASDGADLTVPFDRSQALSPGQYGNVLVQARATLRLREAGLYRFRSLRFESDTHLIVEATEHLTALAVDGVLTLGDRTHMGTGTNRLLDPAKVLFYVAGTSVELGFDTVLAGSLEAPFASIQARDRAYFSGCVAGRSLTLGFDSIVGDGAAVCDPENLVQNPGFEGGTQGWVASGGATLVSTTALAHAGTRGGRVTSRTAAWQGPVYGLLGAAVAGRRYTAVAWAQPGTTAAQPVVLTAKIACNNGAPQFVRLAQSSASNAWVELRGTLDVPQCSLTTLEIYVEGPPSGVPLFVDDVSVAQTCR